MRRKLKKVVVIFAALFLSASSFGCLKSDRNKAELIKNQEVSGKLKSDQIWEGDILVEDNLVIPKGVTLTIKPGTTVKFKHWRYGYKKPENRVELKVEGILKAIGTPEKMIRFTSDAKEPGHADWGEINVTGKEAAKSEVKYAIIEFGIGSFGVYNSSLKLSRSVIRWQWGGGIFLMNSDPVIEYNKFYENGHNNIEVENKAKPLIRYNEIKNASGAGGIAVLDNAEAKIYHNRIHGNKFAGISVENAKADIRYNQIFNNGFSGVEFGGHFLHLRLAYNEISENKAFGLSGGIINKGSRVRAWQNKFVHNKEGEVTANQNITIDAKNNWWNSTSEKEIEQKIEQEDESSSVVYKPFLEEKVRGNSQTGEAITSTLNFDFNEPIDFNPPIAGSKDDKYLYVLPSDETRKVVKSLYKSGMPMGLAFDGEHLWVAHEEKIRKITFEGRELSSFDSPGPWPYGMTFDEKNLWITGYSENKIYQVTREGKVISSFKSPVGLPMALTWDGSGLWLAGSEEGNTLFKLDKKGNVVKKLYNISGGQGLAYDGRYLWVTDQGAYKIRKVDPTNGKVLGAITSPGDRTFDLVWAKGYLFAADWTCESWFGVEKIFQLKVAKVETN